MLKTLFSVPSKWTILWRRVISELEIIGISSLFIVGLMSLFMGGVIALNTAYQLTTPLLPDYTVGYITQQSTFLEFSPTVMSLILAGKVGSNIASEIGTMRVTEQIDALEIMGVNSLNYLVLPKIIAAMLFFPILIICSMALSLIGGWLALQVSGLINTEVYVMGIRSFFDPFHITYALIKAVLLCIFNCFSVFLLWLLCAWRFIRRW